MRVRIAYSKLGHAKYISHLDLTKVFERALRRAGIRMAYSEGFNPHPKIAFGSALAVGVEGEREYVDIELQQDMAIGDIIGKLQEQLPADIRLIEGRVVGKKSKALMAVLNAASYEIKAPMALPIQEERLQEAIRSWLDRAHVMYLRYGKKGRLEKDIRPWIKELEGKIEDEIVVFTLDIEMGNQGSVRPEEVMGSLRELENLPLDLDKLYIRRTGIFVSYDGNKHSPLNFDMDESRPVEG